MAIVTGGVDLGGTKIQTVVVANRKVVGQARHPTPQTTSGDVIATIVAAVREALAAAGAAVGDLRAIGIGTPGTVDEATGHVSNASNVPGFLDDVPLGPTVGKALAGERS